MTMGLLKIGTRGSDLALWQARRVERLIGERLGTTCEIRIIHTRGDRIQNVSFQKMEGKGFFTKELQQALLDGTVDLVVHSLKDLPTEEPEGLAVPAIPERESPADVLLAREGLLDVTPDNPLGLPPSSVLGTSSLRRASQALAVTPSITIRPLRGNVPTRVRKLREGRFDAILLASAGIARLKLDLDGLDVVELPPEVMLPAPAQGALAIETRRDDPVFQLLTPLHDHSAGRRIQAERELLQLLGGGCQIPFGCLATEETDGALRLAAALGVVDEAITRAEVVRVAAVAPEPGKAARACHTALQLAQEKLEAS
ncbi:MAG: hydroxymethylbilane synthase [Acidobacteria bacterium]|nr:hydroxymethylbilane synthase [Acidobacteriota bacterium]